MSLITTVPSEAELASYKVIATIAASNPHWRKLGGGGTPEEIVATILSVMLLAREIGVSPMQAISGGINNIQGKFEVSARIMNQLMRKQGHHIEVRLLNDQVCKIWGKRRDTGEEMEATYHIEEASRAGLIREGGGWKKNPSDMLFARCMSRLIRRLAPDCLGTAYGEGELQETIEKKAVGVPELPEIEVTNVKQPAQLNFDIPQDIEKRSIEDYLKESAETHETTVEVLINAANKRPNDFLNAIRKWEEKNISQAQPEAVEV